MKKNRKKTCIKCDREVVKVGDHWFHKEWLNNIKQKNDGELSIMGD